MPPRFLSVILFTLALAFQVLTPVANGMAAARRLEGAGLSEICLKAGDATDGRRHAPGHEHRHHDCALCQAFCDGVTPLAGRPSSVGVEPVRWTTLHWASANPALPASLRDYARQARAPPIFS